MGQYAVKLTDPADGRGYYLHWSEVVDAPIYVAVSLEDYRAYFRERFGGDGEAGWEIRGCWARLETHGVSTKFYESARDAIRFNRAGPRERQIDITGILDRYCRGRTESGSC